MPRTLGPRVLRRETDTDDDVHESSAEHHQGGSGVVVATTDVVRLQPNPSDTLWRPQLTARVWYGVPLCVTSV